MVESPATFATPHLDIIRATPEHLQALIEGAFEHRFGMPVREGYLEFPEALGWALHQAAAGGVWYLPYLYILREESALVGLGGYKGPPDKAGVVEIGYGVATAYRLRGLATEAAGALVLGAMALDGVVMVCAHTLLAPNPSVGVLERCGFRCVGSVDDPDDGPLLRWEIVREMVPAAALCS